MPRRPTPPPRYPVPNPEPLPVPPEKSELYRRLTDSEWNEAVVTLENQIDQYERYRDVPVRLTFEDPPDFTALVLDASEVPYIEGYEGMCIVLDESATMELCGRDSRNRSTVPDPLVRYFTNPALFPRLALCEKIVDDDTDAAGFFLYVEPPPAPKH